MLRHFRLRLSPARLPLWAALLVALAGQPGWVSAQEHDLDTPIDIILVWVGDQEEEPAAPTEAVEPPAKSPEAAAEPASTLDLAGLETRLRKTKAIGVFTKLELKNQVGDLMKEFNEFHQQNGKLNLQQLEEHFDLLVMKLLVLLQDEDPQLHRDIAQARPALWATLSNPERFAEVHGP